MRISIAAVLFCVCVPALVAHADNETAKDADKNAKKPALAVVEFAGAAELKWTGVQWPDVQVPLTIENRGTTDVKDIHVTLTRFYGTGRVVDPHLNEPAFDLAAGKQHPILLKLAFPIPATYKAQLRVDAGVENAFSGTIVVERTYAPARIEFGPVPAKLVTTLCPRSVDFETTLQTQGDQVTLDPPKLQSVMVKAKPDAAFGIAAPEVELKMEPPFDKAFTIDGTEQKPKLTLTNIRKAGMYEAKVRFRGKGYKETVLPLTVYVREPWWMLLLIIAIGIGLSFSLRTYTSVLRPRMLNERLVATLYSELDEHARLAGADAGALSVVQFVRRQLTTDYRNLSAAAKLTDPATFAVYDLKVAILPHWIALRKRVGGIQPESLRKPFEDRLSAARNALVDTASDAAALTLQRSDLEKMPGEIDVAVKGELLKQLVAFRAELAKDKRVEVRAIEQDLRTVDDDLKNDRLTQAAAGLDAQQKRYVRLLADELSSRLSSTPPIGVAARDWPATLSTITSGLAQARTAPTAAAATEAFRSALTLFLNTALAGLRLHLKERVANARKPEEFAGTEALVKETAALVAKGDLLAAWTKLAESEAAYRAAIEKTTNGKLGPDLAAPFDSLQAMAAPASSAVDVVMTWVFGGGASADVLQRKETMTAISKSIRRLDIAVTIFILLIAVAIGFKTLWADNLTWGGWMSYLIAFLWGVGFDQFGHAGLSTLINKA